MGTLARIDTRNRVLEGRLFGVVHGFLDFLLVATDSLHKSLLVVLEADAVEGDGGVRRVVIQKKRILSDFFLFFHKINAFSHKNRAKIVKNRQKVVISLLFLTFSPEKWAKGWLFRNICVLLRQN